MGQTGITLPHVTSGESPPTVATRLRAALKQRHVSQRELARRIAGKDASKERVENERRQIARYLSGENNPSPEKAERMAAILEQPADHFQTTPGPPRRLLDQIVALRELTEEISAMLDERLPEQADPFARLEAIEASIAELPTAQDMKDALDAVLARLPPATPAEIPATQSKSTASQKKAAS